MIQNKHDVPANVRRNRTIFCGVLLAAAVGGLVYRSVPLVRGLSALAFGFIVGMLVLLVAARTRVAPAYPIAAGAFVTFFGSLALFDAPSGEPLAAILTYFSTVMLVADFVEFRDR